MESKQLDEPTDWEDEGTTKRPELEIFRILYEHRQSHGVSRNDFASYRKSLDTKIKRLSKRLKFDYELTDDVSKNENKIKSKTLNRIIPQNTPEALHPKYILYFVLLAERSWAFGFSMHSLASASRKKTRQKFRCAFKKWKRSFDFFQKAKKIALELPNISFGVCLECIILSLVAECRYKLSCKSLPPSLLPDVIMKLITASSLLYQLNILSKVFAQQENINNKNKNNNYSSGIDAYKEKSIEVAVLKSKAVFLCESKKIDYSSSISAAGQQTALLTAQAYRKTTDKDNFNLKTTDIPDDALELNWRISECGLNIKSTLKYQTGIEAVNEISDFLIRFQNSSDWKNIQSWMDKTEDKDKDKTEDKDKVEAKRNWMGGICDMLKSGKDFELSQKFDKIKFENKKNKKNENFSNENSDDSILGDDFFVRLSSEFSNGSKLMINLLDLDSQISSQINENLIENNNKNGIVNSSEMIQTILTFWNQFLICWNITKIFFGDFRIATAHLIRFGPSDSKLLEILKTCVHPEAVINLCEVAVAGIDSCGLKDDQFINLLKNEYKSLIADIRCIGLSILLISDEKSDQAYALARLVQIRFQELQTASLFKKSNKIKTEIKNISSILLKPLEMISDLMFVLSPSVREAASLVSLILGNHIIKKNIIKTSITDYADQIQKYPSGLSPTFPVALPPPATINVATWLFDQKVVDNYLSNLKEEDSDYKNNLKLPSEEEILISENKNENNNDSETELNKMTDSKQQESGFFSMIKGWMR